MQRSTLVSVASAVSRVLIAPLVLAHRRGRLSYLASGQALSLIPGDVGLALRRAWYSATLQACGERLTVEFGTVLHRRDAIVGDDCYFGEWNRIGRVVIGDDFMSANHVSIMSGSRQHAFDRRDLPMRLQPELFDTVNVGEDVWVGAAAVVAADIAAHTVVGAGAVVTKRFEPWDIVGGVPARVIGTRP